jgi:hypothetical protein
LPDTTGAAVVGGAGAVVGVVGAGGRVVVAVVAGARRGAVVVGARRVVVLVGAGAVVVGAGATDVGGAGIVVVVTGAWWRTSAGAAAWLWPPVATDAGLSDAPQAATTSTALRPRPATQRCALVVMTWPSTAPDRT